MKKRRQKQKVDITEKHYDAFNWCLDHNIRIYPKKRGDDYYLVIENNGVGRTSGILHKENKYQQAIWDAYMYIYKQKNK